MKKQLRIEYKDGSKVKVTNRKATNMSLFINYLKQISGNNIKNATIVTYPIKDNDELVLVKNGVIDYQNVNGLLKINIRKGDKHE